MGAPVVQVVADCLHALQFADDALLNQLFGLAEGRAETALVIDRELHAVGLAGAHHAHRLAIGRGHRLFAVDGLDARFGRGDHHLGVQVRPCADAHDVRLFLGQHGAIVGIELVAAIDCLKRLCIVQLDIRQGHDLGIRRRDSLLRGRDMAKPGPFCLVQARSR